MHGWEWVWGTVDDTSESRDVGKRKWRWQPTSYLLFPIIPYSLCFSFVLRNFCCCEEKEVDGRSTYPDDIMTWIRPSDHRWKVARPKLSRKLQTTVHYKRCKHLQDTGQDTVQDEAHLFFFIRPLRCPIDKRHAPRELTQRFKRLFLESSVWLLISTDNDARNGRRAVAPLQTWIDPSCQTCQLSHVC